MSQQWNRRHSCGKLLQLHFLQPLWCWLEKASWNLVFQPTVPWLKDKLHRDGQRSYGTGNQDWRPKVCYLTYCLWCFELLKYVSAAGNRERFYITGNLVKEQKCCLGMRLFDMFWVPSAFMVFAQLFRLGFFCVHNGSTKTWRSSECSSVAKHVGLAVATWNDLDH